MPGLLRGVARPAAIAGTATAVSNRVSRRQGQRWQRKGTEQYDEQAPAPEPPPEPAAAAPPPSADDTIQQLKDLAALKEQGVTPGLGTEHRPR